MSGMRDLISLHSTDIKKITRDSYEQVSAKKLSNVADMAKSSLKDAIYQSVLKNKYSE